jgi:hypothetical protein
MKKITTTKKIILSIFLFLMIGTIYAFSVPSRGTVITQEVGLAFGKSLGCIGQGLCISVPKECELNKFRIFTTSFVLIFPFEINHLSR